MKDTADPEICLPEQEGFVLISKKRKGKILNRAAATAMTLCLLCALLGVSALALETTTVKIPVSQSADPKSASSTFTYELKANDSSAPMPAGAENGVATLELTGTDEGVFSIDFSEAGTYEYTITQKESSDSKLKHDTTQYTVEVQVLDDGEVQVAAYKPDSSGEKVDKAKEINFAAKTVTSDGDTYSDPNCDTGSHTDTLRGTGTLRICRADTDADTHPDDAGDSDAFSDQSRQGTVRQGCKDRRYHETGTSDRTCGGEPSGHYLPDPLRTEKGRQRRMMFVSGIPEVISDNT